MTTPTQEDKPAPWAGYVMRAHLPNMTEADVMETIADGRMDRLLGRNCSYVMFPQLRTRNGLLDIRPVVRHVSSIPAVNTDHGTALAPDLGTWIPFGRTMFVRTRAKVNGTRVRETVFEEWPLPLERSKLLALKNRRATVICQDCHYALC